jgi:uncharacterized membrane protein
MSKRRVRAGFRVGLALLFVAAGVGHFVRTDFYVRIMPPYLPWHRELVLVSGVFEVLGGLGLLVPALRRAAGWGLLALLVAVFPANVHMAHEALQGNGSTLWLVAMLVRLPLQLVLLAWVWWVMHDD